MKRYFSPILFFLLLLPQILWTSYGHEFHQNWMTTRSEHFILHTPGQYGTLAPEILKTAESVHNRLSPMFPGTTKAATHLVFTDFTDDSNGMATVFPNKIIIMYYRSPGAGEALSSLNDWLEGLLLHEYTHILHMDQSTLLYRILQFPPNALLPTWMIEGLAVWNETEFADAGRGNSSWAGMLYRSAGQTGDFSHFPDLPELSTTPVKYPSGNIPRIYGYAFFDYLAQKAGEESVYKAGDLNRKRLPYSTGGLSRKIWGRPFFQLYREFRIEQARWSFKEKERISKEPVSMSEPFLPVSSTLKHLCIRDNWIYYYTRSPDRRGSVEKFNLKTGKKIILVRDLFINDMVISGNDLIISKMNYTRKNAFHDLYSVPLQGGKQKRLTQGERTSCLFLLNNELCYISSRTPLTQHLCQLTKKKTPAVLHSFPVETQILEASALGEECYFIIRENGKFQDIYSFSPATKELVPLTSSRDLENSLYADPDSGRLFFSADFDAVYNIYSINPLNGKSARHTSVLTGIFSPIVSDEKLYGVLAHADGFSGVCIHSNFSIPFQAPNDNTHKKTNSDLQYFSKRTRLLPGFFSSVLILPHAQYTKASNYAYGISLDFWDIFNVFHVTGILDMHQINSKIWFEPHIIIDIQEDNWGVMLGFNSERIRSSPGADFSMNHFLISGGPVFRKNANRFSTTLFYRNSFSPHDPVYDNQAYGANGQFSVLYSSGKAVWHEKGWRTGADWLKRTSRDIGYVMDEQVLFQADFYLPFSRHIVFAAENQLLLSRPGSSGLSSHDASGEFINDAGSILRNNIGVFFPLDSRGSGWRQMPFYLRGISAGIQFTRYSEADSWKIPWNKEEYYLGPVFGFQADVGYAVPIAFMGGILANLKAPMEWIITFRFLAGRFGDYSCSSEIEKKFSRKKVVPIYGTPLSCGPYSK